MPENERSSRSGCLPVFLFVALLLSGILNFVLLAMLGASSAVGVRGSGAVGEVETFDEELLIDGGEGVDDKIAVIGLDGLIATEIEGDLGETMVEDLSRAFAQASEDEDVKAILFTVNSPGGEVTAADQIYDAVRRARDRKPVVVWMNSVAASGGYYAACGGSHLMANETTLTGSIGVIIQTLNYVDLFGKVGLDAVVFKSGKFKDMLSGAREITPEERAYVEGLVQEIYSRFVGIVAKERGLDEGMLRAGVADGRILSGKSALEEKLIDSTGQFEDAVAKAKEIGKTPDAKVVRYSAGFRLRGLLRLLGSSSAGNTVRLELPEQLRPVLKPGRVYLLPPFMAP